MARIRYEGQTQRFRLREVISRQVLFEQDFPRNPERKSMAAELDRVVAGYMSSWPKYLRPVPNVDLWQGLHKEGIRGRRFATDYDPPTFTLRDLLALGMLYVDGHYDETPSRPGPEWFGLDSTFMNVVLEVYLNSYECRLSNRSNSFFFPIIHTLSTSDREFAGEYGGGEGVPSDCVSEDSQNCFSYHIACRLERCYKFRSLRTVFKTQLRDQASFIYDQDARRYHLFVRYNATKWVIMRFTIEPWSPVKVIVHLFDMYNDIHAAVCPRVERYAASIACHLRLMEEVAQIAAGPELQVEWANNRTKRDSHSGLKMEVHVLRHHSVFKRMDHYSTGHCALGQFLCLLDAGVSERELDRCVNCLQERGIGYLCKLLLSDFYTGYVKRSRIIE